ncbi:hypothetical protein C9J12_03820 [Photobacterium frigidiphilum]|uniref:Uncharacterized protein n=1 Tax=Photobacterium frigidiphilum TaxID=264736 RepID=A0A2T3JNB6_9GAMM|nr:hypothetical protein [Photobacterium frigidiphilum]PSU50463.1 hypothetical protein C9J12_03820 [Photobacterium frigidiphilum]
MRNIAGIIEQLESGKQNFNIWVYSSKDYYCKFGSQSNKPRTFQLQKAIEQHLQVIVEMHNYEIDNAFLFLPEIHAVIPVNFHDGHVLSTHMTQVER